MRRVKLMGKSMVKKLLRRHDERFSNPRISFFKFHICAPYVSASLIFYRYLQSGKLTRDKYGIQFLLKCVVDLYHMFLVVVSV